MKVGTSTAFALLWTFTVVLAWVEWIPPGSGVFMGSLGFGVCLLLALDRIDDSLRGR